MANLLNHEEIKAKSLLKHTNDDRYGIASYDLRINSIYPLDTRKSYKNYDLEPQGMALVTTIEEFQLPYNIQGYTTIRNQMSIQGILAINIGIVDPGYKGPISTILINFGKNNFPIKHSDSVLRMTFHEITTPAIKARKVETYQRDIYEKNRKNEVRASLESTFLNLEKTKSQIKKEILNDLLKWTGLLAFLVILSTFILNYGMKIIEILKSF